MKLAETFTSFQGEGALAGRLMHFIRFAGCLVKTCQMHPINTGTCDTDWAYRGPLVSASAVADEALSSVGPMGWVCVTGGEPLEQPEAFEELVYELRIRGLMINLQTSGTRRLPVEVDWLTVSPKGRLKITRGNELKVVYDGQPDSEIVDLVSPLNFDRKFLMPFWSPDGELLQETMDAIRRLDAMGLRMDLATQAHKTWKVR